MDYQKECLRTCSYEVRDMAYVKERAKDLGWDVSRSTLCDLNEPVITMCALGACGEVAEALESVLWYAKPDKEKTALEIGDAMYYTATALKAMDFNIVPRDHDPFEPTNLACCELHLRDAAIAAGKYADMVKKWQFHSHEFEWREAKDVLEVLFDTLVRAGASIGYRCKEIQQMNVDKLRKRYPNGFEAARSINREEQE